MILAHGSLFQDKLSFIYKKLCCWYKEHFRAFEVNASHLRELDIVEHAELLDDFPLVCYSFVAWLHPPM